jgi:UDP-perosamine 4-acetyltransferase
MAKSTIVIGGGGHAKVVIDTLLLLGVKVIGYLDPKAAQAPILGVPRLGSDDILKEFSPADVVLANGLASIKSVDFRHKVYSQAKAGGYSFMTIVHPSAFVSPHSNLHEGVQVMAGAVVQAHASVSANALLNTGCSVDHDVTIGGSCHIAPGVTICGFSRVEECCHIGTGSVILQSITIGARTSVGAGSLVLKDLPPDSFAFGRPAEVRAAGQS